MGAAHTEEFDPHQAAKPAHPAQVTVGKSTFKRLVPTDVFDIPTGAVDERKEARYLREDIDHWKEFRKDPLFPYHYWRYNYFTPGIGFFTEGFVLFSWGNIKSLFRATWPRCFKLHTPGTPHFNYKPICNPSWVESIDYLQISGILFGQIVLGFFTDAIGRRRVQIFDAFNMTIGVILLACLIVPNLYGYTIALAWAFFFYGFGVGGEYPTTSSIAAEKAESSPHLQKSRGKTVVLTFCMQGWGQILNVGVLLILLMIFNGNGNAPYSPETAHAVFSTSYALIFPFMLYMIYWRVWRQRENAQYERVKAELDHVPNIDPKTHKAMKKRKSKYDWHNFYLMMAYFWPRMLASAGGWFINDVGFYGGKVFIGDFVSLMHPKGAPVSTTWLYTLLQTVVQIFGYYLAAYMIDLKWYGRRRMQMVGFFVLFICYGLTGILYPTFTSQSHPVGYQVIFYIQAFFQQFGPNCTTFLIPVEIFPTAVRGTAHGLSAAAGKLGALVPEIIFNYVTKRTRFWISCGGNFVGFFFTMLFLPDTTSLSLEELDRWWVHIKEGEASNYHGPAISKPYLSMWERWVMRWHRFYDPKLDAQQKAAEHHDIGNGAGLSMSMVSDTDIVPSKSVHHEARIVEEESPRSSNDLKKQTSEETPVTGTANL